MNQGSTLNHPILVSGGHGFIGRRLRFLACKRGFEITAPHSSEVDWTDAASLRELMIAVAPGVVIHLASPGVFAPDPYDPTLIDLECKIMHNLLATVPAGCRIIGCGSMAEYGRSGKLSEDMVCFPNNAYARAKFEAGQMLLGAIQAGNVTGCHARIFGVYGPGEASTRLFPKVIESLSRKENVLLSDGYQLRDFVHVDDVANAILRLATENQPIKQIINIGTGKSVPVREAVLRVARELDASDQLLKFGSIGRSPHDQDQLEADTFRLREALSWVPPQRFFQSEPITALM